MPRAPGRITADGDRATAEILVEALRAPHDDRETAESLTHPFHTYPARLHPATARVLVEIVGARRRPHAPIVDPFCGSGTVLVETRAAGLRAVGVDLNPLAVLVARAKTWTVPPRRAPAARRRRTRSRGSVLAAGKAARRSGAEPAPLRKPRGFDPNARNRRLASWFAPHVRRELELIAAAASTTSARATRELADVLHRVPVGDPLQGVVAHVRHRRARGSTATSRAAPPRGCSRSASSSSPSASTTSPRTRGPVPDVFEHDARRLADVVPDGTAAGVVTSPPYAGTYDYAEHQRLRFDFLALRHRELRRPARSARAAASRSNPNADARVARRAGRHRSPRSPRALAPGAAAAIVIGDSVARNRAIYALDDVRDALTDDLTIEAWASQQRPMLGAAEKRAFGERGKAEHVIVLRRTG